MTTSGGKRKGKLGQNVHFEGYKWGKNSSLLQFWGIEMGKLSSPEHFGVKLKEIGVLSSFFGGYK